MTLGKAIQIAADPVASRAYWCGRWRERKLCCNGWGLQGRGIIRIIFTQEALAPSQMQVPIGKKAFNRHSWW